MGNGTRGAGAALGCALALAAAGGAQEASWLPPQVAEGAAQQLAERMTRLPELFGGAEPEAERLVGGARQMVGAMVAVIDGWGVEGTLARAPELPMLSIPSAGDRHLDAMARYQVCNLLLFLQLEDPAYNEDLNLRMTSVFGLTGVTLAAVSLREPFTAGGGDPAAIETHLSGPALEPAFEALQIDAEARAAAEQACQPVVIELVDGPLSGLGH